jgi:hypothetical protein
MADHLTKIGKEGFGIIDKYYGRPKRHGYGNKVIYLENEQVIPQMKEPINKSNMPNGSFAGQPTFRVIYRSEAIYYAHG